MADAVADVVQVVDDKHMDEHLGSLPSEEGGTLLDS